MKIYGICKTNNHKYMVFWRVGQVSGCSYVSENYSDAYKYAKAMGMGSEPVMEI